VNYVFGVSEGKSEMTMYSNQAFASSIAFMKDLLGANKVSVISGNSVTTAKFPGKVFNSVTLVNSYISDTPMNNVRDHSDSL